MIRQVHEERQVEHDIKLKQVLVALSLVEVFNLSRSNRHLTIFSAYF